MKSYGSTVTGIANHNPLPIPARPTGARPASFVHQTPRPRATGLDWSALTPACSSCGTRSPEVGCETGLCPTCARPAPVVVAPSPVAPRRLANRKVVRRAKTTRRPVPSGERRRGVRPDALGDADKAKIVEAYATGETCVAIAARIGKSKSTVQRVVRASGIPMRDDRAGHSGGTRTVYPDHVVRRIVEGYEAGQTMAALQAELVMHQRTIRRILVENDVTIRPPANKRPGMRNQPARAAAEASLGERLRAAGVTTRQVKEWAVEHGHMAYVARGRLPSAVLDAYVAAHTKRSAA